MGCVGPLSGCYPSFLFNTSKLSELGYKLAGILVEESKECIGMKTDVSFLLSK